MSFKRRDFIDISGVIYSNELDFLIIEMKKKKIPQLSNGMGKTCLKLSSHRQFIIEKEK